MKKVIVLIAIFALSILIIGCSKTDSNDTTDLNPEYCDGTVGIFCSQGYECQVDEENPMGGICVEVEKTPEETTFCTEEYDPVCGINNVTYSNRCFAGETEIQYKGECLSENMLYVYCGGIDKIICSNGYECLIHENVGDFSGHCVKSAPRDCSNYEPVCGWDKVTYDNLCKLEEEPMEMAYEGECLNDKVTLCINFGGNWRENYNECEYIDEKSCDIIGGQYNECVPNCRYQDVECDGKCVSLCKILNI